MSKSVLVIDTPKIAVIAHSQLNIVAVLNMRDAVNWPNA